MVIDPIRDEAGKLVGFAKVTRDITERMRVQHELKEIQDQLAASQKMEAIGQLTGGIAHDFNNLLMIVLGNLETAQRDAQRSPQPNADLNRTIASAMRGAQRAAALTSRLLAFSRRQPLDPKPIDVNKFLASAADFLQRSLGETIDVEVVGSAGLWQIEADPNHLESALVNLALKWPRCHTKRRQVDYRGHQHFRGRRILPRQRRALARPICSDLRQRQWKWHAARRSQSGLRAIFHH